MKKMKIFTAFFCSFFLISIFFNNARVYAQNSASMTFDKSSYAIPKGGNATVKVMFNPAGTEINLIHVVFSYPSDKIQVVDISYENSPFQDDINESTSGLIDITLYQTGVTTSSAGEALSIVFKGLDSGNGTFQISSESELLQSAEPNANILATGTRGSATFSVSSTLPETSLERKSEERVFCVLIGLLLISTGFYIREYLKIQKKNNEKI